MAGNEVDYISFNTLDADRRKYAPHLFAQRQTIQKQKKLHVVPQLLKFRESLKPSLIFYSKELDSTYEELFPYLIDARREALWEQLYFMYLFFHRQMLIAAAFNQEKERQDLEKKVNRCVSLLGKLPARSPLMSQHAAVTNALFEANVAYLGLTLIAPMVATGIQKMFIKNSRTDDIASDIVKWLSLINFWRLYWVWVGMGGFFGQFLPLIAELLPTLGDHASAAKWMSLPSVAAGYMSWTLYYARLGIYLFLVAKHTLGGPWLSEEEQQLTAWERFKIQMNMTEPGNQFDCGNEIGWGNANFACDKLLDAYWGAVITEIFLFMDLCLTLIKFYQQWQQHLDNVARYQRGIAELARQISELKAEEVRLRAIDPNDPQLLQLKLNQDKLRLEKKSIEANKDQEQFDWTYQRAGLINETVYAVNLIIANFILSDLLVPEVVFKKMLSDVAGMALGTVGGALCFLATLVMTMVSGYLEISKNMADLERLKSEWEQYRQEICDFKSGKNSLSLSVADQLLEKKRLYLKMEAIEYQLEPKKQLTGLLVKKVLSSGATQLIMPGILFGAFMVLSGGYALIVVGVAILLSVILSARLERSIAANGEKAINAPKFDQKKFDYFDRNINRITIDNPLSKMKFFPAASTAPSSASVSPSDSPGDTPVPPDADDYHLLTAS